MSEFDSAQPEGPAHFEVRAEQNGLKNDDFWGEFQSTLRDNDEVVRGIVDGLVYLQGKPGEETLDYVNMEDLLFRGLASRVLEIQSAVAETRREAISDSSVSIAELDADIAEFERWEAEFGDEPGFYSD